MTSPPRRPQTPGAAVGATPPADTAATSGLPVRLLPVALAFAGMCLVALALVNAGAALGHVAPAGLPVSWLEPWVRFDSGWYATIATQGYSYTPGVQSSVAFFPTYPLLMRVLSAVVEVHVAGVLLTLASGLVSVLAFTRWCQGRLSSTATTTAVAILLLYPYSVFLYGAVYADALFLACALGAFLLLESGHPWLAGLVGALATAGRPVGIAVAAGLVVRAIELAAQRPGATPGEGAAASVLRRLRWSDSGVLLSMSGLIGYMAFQWVAFDMPLAFVATQRSPGWDQGTGLRVWLKAAFFGQILHGEAVDKARLAVPAVLCLVTVLLLPQVRRRFGWGYAVYVGIAAAMPILGTKDFAGSGRYLLATFPVFAILGHLLTERWPRWARGVVLGAAALLFVMAALAHGQGVQIS